MFSRKEMDETANSGTGVFYQAMPAIGADGKNIMKLIPVQIVNGQFVQMHMSNSKHTPKKPVTTNIVPALQQVASAPSSTQQCLRKQFPHQNVLPSPVNPGLNKHLPQQETVTVPPVTLPFTNAGTSVDFFSPSPVTVTSPALSKGQSLQIPVNAKVHTAPASELLSGFNKQTFTLPAISAVRSGLPSTGYMSPVTLKNRVDTPPSKSTCPSVKLLSKTSTQTSCGLSQEGAKPLLKLTPVVSQRPNSPIKWVVEEVGKLAAPNPKAPDSPSLTSKVLETVAGRQNAETHQNMDYKTSGFQSSTGAVGSDIPTKWMIEGNDSAGLNVKPASSHYVPSEIHHAMAERVNTQSQCDPVKKTVSQSPQDNGGHGDQILVICNGKPFLVGEKRGRLPCKPTATMKSSEVNQQTLGAAVSQTRQEFGIPRDSDEVIDLCDDDTPDESPQDAASHQTLAVPPSEEDNVIFVSYSPPKSQPSSTSNLVPKLQVAPVNEKDLSSLNNSTEAVREDDSNQRTSVMCDPGVSDAATSHHAGTNMENQQRISTPQQNVLGDAKTESQADPNINNDNSDGKCFQTEITHKVQDLSNITDTWTSPIEPKSPPMTDHQLREFFGIRADVKVCLMKNDEARSHSVPADLAHDSFIKLVQEDEKPTRVLMEKSLLHQDFCIPHEPHVQIGRIEGEQELSSTPHTDIVPLKYSYFNLNTKPPSLSKQNSPSGQVSCSRISCDSEIQPLIGYMEPIDENFLNADQQHFQTCLDQNSNSKRMGRTRKRTMCPCCSPATLDHVVKCSPKLQKCELTTETKNKRGAGQKLPTTDGQLSGRLSSPAAKNKSNCRNHHSPAGNS